MMTEAVKKLLSYKVLFFVLSAVFLVGFPLLSFDFGITWDEWMDSNNGMLSLRYLLSFGEDRSFLDYWHGIYYSQLFYIVTGAVYGIVHGNLTEFVNGGFHQDAHILPFFHVSHTVNSLFGFVGMFYAGLLARRIGGWRAGCLALLFMALSPRYLGNAMNDPKDIPFLAGNTVALYYLIAFLEGLPKTRIRTVLALGFGIGIAIGTRLGGFVQVFYLFLFGGLGCLDLFFIRKVPGARVVQIFFWLFAVAVLGYLVALCFWPYGQLAPIRHLFESLREVANFRYWEGVVLFEGKIFSPHELPWYYIPKWILISSPLFFVIGIMLFVLVLPRLHRVVNFRLWVPVLFVAVFPLVYVILGKSMLLDSWRHLLFVYPPLVVLSALAWESVFQWAGTRAARSLLGGLIVFLLALPLEWMIRNHPHAYVYFNPMVGGINGAFARYETDYWGNSLKEASEWLAMYHKKTSPQPLALVRADGSVMSSYPYLKKELGSFYRPFGYAEDFLKSAPYAFINHAPYLQGPRVWNYALVLSRGWAPEKLRSPDWPPDGTVYEVKADHVTLCAVVKNAESPINKVKWKGPSSDKTE